ncbi:MAG: uroporphyrinogen-III synthase [Armatimonadetes bacterium]|nr:uroporphyrinogen-III synthase [Armatimonadota bacterium]
MRATARPPSRRRTRQRRPLAGRRILVTRPRAQSRDLCARLRSLGALAIAVPTIDIVAPSPGGPLDRALCAVDRYDWVVVTSPNGAHACLSRARALGVPLHRAAVRWAAVGPATAAALRAAGIPVAMIPSRYLTAAIARELRDVAGRRILLPRTDAASPTLAEELRARGAVVDQITAYRTVLAPLRHGSRLRRLVTAHAVDTILLTSASTVNGLVRLLGRARTDLAEMTIACIGPITAAAAAAAGLRPDVVAREHTVEGLIQALLTTQPKGGRYAAHRVAR